LLIIKIKFDLTVVLQLPVLFLLLQVGLACVQLGKVLGCTVLGTAGTPDGMQLVVDNGAAEVFNHREKGYADKIMVLFSFSLLLGFSHCRQSFSFLNTYATPHFTEV
jgi:hypothetical protein